MAIESAVLSGGIKVTQTNALDLGTGNLALTVAGSIAYTDGVGANQADRLFSDRRTLGISASEDLDLSGVLADAFGATIAFARIKAIVVKAAAGNTNNVVVGGAASNQFVGPFGSATHTVAVPPGGFVVFAAPSAAGWPVTAGTADILKIANSGAGTGVTYDIALLGASA